MLLGFGGSSFFLDDEPYAGDGLEVLPRYASLQLVGVGEGLLDGPHLGVRELLALVALEEEPGGLFFREGELSRQREHLAVVVVRRAERADLAHTNLS